MRSTIGGSTCREQPAAATLMYPEPGARNVSTSLSEVVLSGADGGRRTGISLIDSAGRQIVIGPLAPVPRPSGAPDGAAYESAAVDRLAPETNYIVLYSPIACTGRTDYAIGSFTTE